MSASEIRISERERFLFDLNGFLHLKNVFSPEEVAMANEAIDEHSTTLHARDAASLKNTMPGTPLAATGPRMDLGGMLWWPKPYCLPFRKVLTHPTLVPYLTEFCGDGYRMDHQPLVIAQDQNSEGFSLHGGPISGDDGQPAGKFNPELQYRCVNGEIWTSLLAVSVVLCDHEPGSGGFCILRGSHKLNLPVPQAFANGVPEEFSEHIYHPNAKAGDVLIWSEATVHGATPWLAEHQRRLALFRFAPANMGYGRGYTEIPSECLDDLSPLERAVLLPPYATRLERPLVTVEAAAAAAAAQAAGNEVSEPPLKKRSAGKKEFDKKLFGTSYF